MPPPGGQRRSLDSPGGNKRLGDGKQAPSHTLGCQRRQDAMGWGRDVDGPQVSRPPPPLPPSPGHPQWPDPHQPPALKTLPQPRGAPGGPKVTASSDGRRLVNKRRGAPTLLPAARKDRPQRRSGRPGWAADPRGQQRSLARRRAPAPLCVQDLPPGRGPAAESWGPGRGAPRPSVLTPSRGLSQRDWRRRRRRFYLCRRGSTY